ncbi:MAG TPA: F0F1 ATP synthase subunit A [Magnetospirillaceae bacterium]|nr:F0F1 ATP synthase subunit A [Magnetospirillaceae bacterium]
MFKLIASAGVPLAAEPVFHIGSFPVTNAMLFGVITGIAVIALFMAAAKRSTVKPKSKFAFAIESLVDFLFNIARENFSNPKQARKHLPLLLTLFTFIIIANLSGLIPGVGTVVTTTPEGEIPLLRAFTTDLNATLALAVLTIGTVQFYAIKELGIMGHLRHYFTNKPWNPMNMFIGLIEVMGEFIRILTLSMRLFGVIYAGEVLLHVIGELAGNFGWAATVPVYLMEIFFSAIQAYLFVMLTTVYLSIATAHNDESPEHEDFNETQPQLQSAADGNKK